jgi:D-galactose 1-dehydrogenase
MTPIRIALVGVGKIARDQHVPAIAASADFELIATASRHGRVDGVAAYPDIATMLAEADVEAVALCMPPQSRHAIARAALQAGKHVFLEKPPGATIAAVQDLVAFAEVQGGSLFASWHSRHAPGVAAARDWLTGRRVRQVRIDWKEDVRHWHPGQDWIFEAGGLGVFDPGINALSIATHILPRPFMLDRATLSFPANRDAPIAAELAFSDSEGADIQAVFDFRQTGPQSWDMLIETDDGRLTLGQGGSVLTIDGVAQPCAPEAEYPGLYAHFADLVRTHRSDVDLAPLVHVADAFMLGHRAQVAAFDW